MNIPRYIFIVAILLVFSLCSPVEAVKHIIIIYDVSSSMYRLNRSTGIDTKMESEDIRRVNDYLINLLFTNTSQSLRSRDDTHIKECDDAYVGKPLYQNGDIITYAEYANRRYTKIDRKQVRRYAFQRKLPDPMNLSESFYGRVSYLLRAETEVYDELYREADSETYWIFVTDGDVDQSGGSDPNIDEVLRQHAAIEDKYEDPMITGILVNRHVKIEVRRIQKRGVIDAVFIANRTALNEPVKEIHLSKDDTGKFISEALIIDTNNSDKAKFKLDSVNVEVFNKYDQPLQIANDDNGFDVLKVTPVALHRHSPPHEFQISLPANPEIAAPGNALKLEVVYDYNGNEKIHPIPLTDYETVIKSIFVSDLDSPNQQEDKVELRFSDDSYRATLVVRSESPNKTAFRIRDIRCHIEYKNGQKLCEVTVATIPQKLDEPFQLKALNDKNLDLYGNKLVLDIDYNYKGTAESASIELPLELHGGNQGFLIGLLIILGIVVLAVVVFTLVRFIQNMLPKSGVEYKIALGVVDQENMLPNEEHPFTLAEGEMLLFGSGHTDGLHFDIGSPAVLRCRRGTILLYENVYDEEGRVLTSGETLTLTRDEGSEVRIHFKIVDDEPQPSPYPDTSIDAEDDNLLPD